MTIEYRVENCVARVTINRPERMNAIGAAAERELERVWGDIEARSDISCVVITGAGEKAFCAGADMKDATKQGVDYWLEHRPHGFGGLAFRRSLNVPVIGRINGVALGGGFELALGCDLLIAAPHARFGLPEARVGRVPLDGGMVLLQRKIPYNQAMAVLLTGKQFSAADMLAFGIVNVVAPQEQLDDTVAQWVDDITRCAPLSLRAIKYTVKNTGHLAPQEAQALRTDALIRALQSEDAREGVAAFQQKRAPTWRGR